MSIRYKPLESIEQSDLQGLVDNQVIEIKTIEYKEILPSNSDGDKKEFLADVSSFSNASGGDLVFGMKETSGIPSELCGLRITNIDAEKRRLENMILNGIAPRIPGISIRHIPLQGPNILGPAIIIRIARSWALPHMVTYQGSSRFYSRNASGKHQLDVSEIRVLFALSEATLERIRRFRVERLSNIIAKETPIALDDAPKIVLHIVPFNAFDPAAKFDIRQLLSKVGHVKPMRTGIPESWYNFDGYLAYRPRTDSASARAYLQIFRNGCIESVEASLLKSQDRTIVGTILEKMLLDELPKFLKYQEILDVEPPLFVMVSLLGVSGYSVLYTGPIFTINEGRPIDRDFLSIPEVVIEDFQCDLAEVMKPIFDTIWNAAGWPGSMNYVNGKWVGKL